MTVVVPAAIVPAGEDAFNDFIDLRTAVIENVKRPDIADVFPRLLALAEARIARELRLREQMTTTTLILSGGVSLLPTDFLEPIGLYAANGYEYPQESSQAHTSQTGPYFYSIEGNFLHGPMDSAELQFDYYARFPALGATVTTSNALLSRYPDVHLYTTAFEAAKYVQDADMASINADLAREAINTARADDQRARYARAVVRVRGNTP